MSKSSGLALIALILGATFVGLSLTPLLIARTDVDVRVLDKADNQPIRGALVQFDLYGWGGQGTIDYTAYTDSQGVASVGIVQGIYSIIVSAQGYQTFQVDDVDLRSLDDYYYESLTYYLSKDTGYTPPTGETVTFYFLNPDKSRIRGCTVEIDNKEGLSDADGFTQIIDVQPGSYMARFYGRYRKDTLTWIDFDFSHTVTVVSDDYGDGNINTVYTSSGTVVNETPPKPPEPDKTIEDRIDAFIMWLTNNIIMVFLILVGLYIFGVLFIGTGPQLLRMTRK